MKSPARVISLIAAFLLLAPVSSRAAFHIAVIDDVMSGAGGGNSNIQYVEIRQLIAGNNNVCHTRLTVFNWEMSVHMRGARHALNERSRTRVLVRAVEAPHVARSLTSASAPSYILRQLPVARRSRHEALVSHPESRRRADNG